MSKRKKPADRKTASMPDPAAPLHDGKRPAIRGISGDAEPSGYVAQGPEGERLALDYAGGGIVDISCPPRPPDGAPESKRLAWLKRRCETLQACFSEPARHYPNCEREEARDWLAAAYSAACDWLPPATVGECEHLETVDAAERNPSEARAELARLAQAATTHLLELRKPGRPKLTRTEQVALVVATVYDNPNASDRELAKLMSIPPSTFRAWPEYRRAREANMGDAPARGHKMTDKETGKKTGKRIEATRERLPARGRPDRPHDD